MAKHTCHWPGCQTAVSPKMWGCKKHWFKLPKNLRDLIWRAYVPGQEITKTPSPAYIAAANTVQAWIRRSAEHRAAMSPLTPDQIEGSDSTMGGMEKP